MIPKHCFRRLLSVPKVSLTRSMSSQPRHFLTLENLNPNVRMMKYAIRGPLDVRASEIQKELEKSIKKPFTEVIKANIGDCHAMGQVPITFIRQVLALVTYPPLFDSYKIPEDAKERARTILSSCRGSSVGSYTEEFGIDVIRRHVAEYIQKRDSGIPSDWRDIVLSSGTSDGIKQMLKLFVCNSDGKPTGVMIPIPRHPLYSASVEELGMHQIGYYLDEPRGWELNIAELQSSIDEARKLCNPRVLVVINPGNPTGQVLSRDNIEEVIKFAHKEHLYLLADEVYQDNVYTPDDEFYSFKKVLTEMGERYSKMELASFMSCSKGYMGECGLRGGYAEVINMCPEVKAMYFKAATAMLCPTVLGQACLAAVVRPPEKGEPSYKQFIAEKKAVLEASKLRAKMVVETFNSIEGFSCNKIQGAVYAFPRIRLPPKAIKAAEKANQAPDVFYAFQLLENTGVCVIPGSELGHKPGTFHFRITMLAQTNKLRVMLEKFKTFHIEFVSKYT